MSVQSHLWNDVSKPAQAGRPPYEAAPPVGCGKLIQVNPDMPPRPCWSYGLWLLPELPRCAHHLPTELLPLVQERLALWAEFAGELWEDVRLVLPFVPPGGDAC